MSAQRLSSEPGRNGLIRQLAVAGLVCFALAVALLSVPAVAFALTGSLQIYPALTASDVAATIAGPPAAIVILSAGTRAYAPEFGGESVDELSLERIRYGAMLARQTRLPVLVTGGPSSTGGAAVARLMADTLDRDYGISPKWVETRSATTAENAIFSGQMLNRAGIKRVLLVTHAWHMKRARAAFAANGLNVIPAPTAFYSGAGLTTWNYLLPSMRSLRMSGYALHEIIGGGWYALHYGY